MITAYDKAKGLVEKFRDDKFTSQVTTAGAKRCAEICVQEIIKEFAELNEDDETETLWSEQKEKYWQTVLTEIKSL